jgi:hypothetical protein
MNQFDPQTNAADEAEPQNQGSLPPEVVDETDTGIVAETARPRNSTTLFLVVLLLIGGGAVLLMRMKAGPSATAAAPTPQAATAKATISQFLSDGGQSLNAMRELLKNTEKVVQQFMKFPSQNQVKVEDLKTNPFTFGTPKKETPVENTGPTPEQREKDQILAAIRKLQIQSILRGAVSSCMINNKMYTEGQEIDSFTIEKITADGVTIKRHAPVANKVYRFELKMVRPN